MRALSSQNPRPNYHKAKLVFKELNKEVSCKPKSFNNPTLLQLSLIWQAITIYSALDKPRPSHTSQALPSLAKLRSFSKLYRTLARLLWKVVCSILIKVKLSKIKLLALSKVLLHALWYKTMALYF